MKNGFKKIQTAYTAEAESSCGKARFEDNGAFGVRMLQKLVMMGDPKQLSLGVQSMMSELYLSTIMSLQVSRMII